VLGWACGFGSRNREVLEACSRGIDQIFTDVSLCFADGLVADGSKRLQKNGFVDEAALGKCVVGLIADGGRDDLLLFDGAIACAFFDGFEFFHDFDAFDDFTEDGVIHMEPWSRCGGDEELAAVGAGA